MLSKGDTFSLAWTAPFTHPNWLRDIPHLATKMSPPILHLAGHWLVITLVCNVAWEESKSNAGNLQQTHKIQLISYSPALA
jgi:hypothetical protein